MIVVFPSYTCYILAELNALTLVVHGAGTLSSILFKGDTCRIRSCL